MKIVIPLDDWEDEFDEFGERVEDKEAIIRISQKENRPGPILLGRLAVIDREKHGGTAVEDHKYTLNIGAAKQISQTLAQAKRKVNLKNGKPVTVRTYVCPVHKEGEAELDEDNAVADSMSNAGYNNAINYLKNIIPGAIYGRLVIIAASPFNGNGAVREYAEWLKDKIDEMVDRLEVSVS